MPTDHQNWPIFGPFEVAVHNQLSDCWVSLLGKVLDITPLIAEYQNQRCVTPLLAMAGKDISHWFDEKTGDIQHYVHPVTGARVPYCPHGPLPDVSVGLPATSWKALQKPPWWNDETYQVGLLTKKVRPLKIINMVTRKPVELQVCCEDTFFRIRERFRMFNSNANSYTWRYLDDPIDMTKTLEENGIPDERDRFTELGLPPNYYIPSIFLYFNDDLKDLEEELEAEENEGEEKMDTS